MHSLLVTLAGCSLSGQMQKLRNPWKSQEQESKKMASVYLGLRLLHGLQVSHVTGILFTLFTTTSSSPRRVTRAQVCLTSCLSAAHHSWQAGKRRPTGQAGKGLTDQKERDSAAARSLQTVEDISSICDGIRTEGQTVWHWGGVREWWYLHSWRGGSSPRVT